MREVYNFDQLSVKPVFPEKSFKLCFLVKDILGGLSNQ